MQQNNKPIFLLIAWLIALIATVVPLYASLVLKMPVCELCWLQRICIFPLAIQLGIANFRQDLKFSLYGMPLALLGAVFALYQYLLQKIPALSQISFCHSGAGEVSCSAIDWQIFGFITFPLLSFLTSLLLFFLLMASYSKFSAEMKEI